MQVFGESIFMVSAEDQDTVGTIKAMVEAQGDVPVTEQVLTYQGQVLRDDQTAAECGLKDNELIMMNRR